jgi:hypothetical protein
MHGTDEILFQQLNTNRNFFYLYKSFSQGQTLIKINIYQHLLKSILCSLESKTLLLNTSLLIKYQELILSHFYFNILTQ